MILLILALPIFYRSDLQCQLETLFPGTLFNKELSVYSIKSKDYMSKELIHQSVFEKLKHIDKNGNEYWSARDMAKILEYSEYRHFLGVIEKAKEACRNSGFQDSDHFEDLLDMITIGKGGQRQVENVKLSRYAGYLIVQNADPSKEIVATGQTYFAVQCVKP
ncbi:MAG: BRO family protein [Bacteroidota bacterium]